MNDYLQQINVKGVLYDISGGAGSGVTSGDVQTMLEEYTYDKQTIDDKISSGGGSSSAVTVLSGDVITISGDVISLSGDVQNISGDVIVLSGDVRGLEGKIDALSGNVYTKDEVDDKIDEAVSGKTDFSDFSAHTANTAIHLTSGDVAAQMSAYTYDKDTIDNKIASGGGITSGDVQTMIDESISGKANTSDVITDLEITYDEAPEEDNHFYYEYRKGGTSTVAEIFTPRSGLTVEVTQEKGYPIHYLDVNSTSAVKSGSTKIPTSNAVYNAVSTKAEASDVLTLTTDLTADENNIATLSGDINTIKLSSFTDAEYDSVNKFIKFKNASGTVIDQIDATDFIKDGMIEDVTISGTDLVITFNIESGHEDIVISLSSIFNPNNYYTKTEVNNLIANKADVWCGSMSDWAQISGSTQSGVIYLVY